EECHKLKGSCGNVGANRLYQLASQQEGLVLEKNWERARELQQELIQSLEELKKFINHPNNS
ncbi:MAG: hypothetical protein EPN84_08745, partial [Legionella sp.]